MSFVSRKPLNVDLETVRSGVPVDLGRYAVLVAESTVYGHPVSGRIG